jgi:hypothetical protein
VAAALVRDVDRGIGAPLEQLWARPGSRRGVLGSDGFKAAHAVGAGASPSAAASQNVPDLGLVAGATIRLESIQLRHRASSGGPRRAIAIMRDTAGLHAARACATGR